MAKATFWQNDPKKLRSAVKKRALTKKRNRELMKSGVIPTKKTARQLAKAEVAALAKDGAVAEIARLERRINVLKMFLAS